ncbi:MAG: hypothetical protein IBJ11_12400, partial [Phycisphaerales bacterium]|nr:hypothetical protein [Phycisphaerales bacterium]
VHLGHADLIRSAREMAGPAGTVVALVFDPNPLAVLRPAAAPGTLMPFARREHLLTRLGADRVVRLEPTPELLAQPPEAFVRRVAETHHPTAWVEGEDFRFGKGRAGDNGTLAAMGQHLGFALRVVPDRAVELSDQTLVKASSTIARWLVGHGRMADAARVLGRPYELIGQVVRGDRRGRQIGFPTANLRTDQMLPADGVYAGHAALDDGRRFSAAIHVGPRATFDAMERTVEAFILDWPGPVAEGRPEYGWGLRLEVRHWLRELAKFEGVAPLVEQMNRDVERARALCPARTPEPAGVSA